MASHDKQLIAEIMPLLDHVRGQAGQWVPLQVDRDREFQSALHWVTTNVHSPYQPPEDAGRRSTYVLEWARADGTWGGPLKAQGVWIGGERVGRLRYRLPRKRAGHGPAAG